MRSSDPAQHGVALSSPQLRVAMPTARACMGLRTVCPRSLLTAVM
jgi:hypothetical protein